jgi:hypothetical protein
MLAVTSAPCVSWDDKPKPGRAVERNDPWAGAPGLQLAS